MHSSEENEIAFSTHLSVLVFNLLLIVIAVDFFKGGTVLIRDMANVSGAPAEITIFLVFLCVVAIDYIYVKGLLKHKNESI